MKRLNIKSLSLLISSSLLVSSLALAEGHKSSEKSHDHSHDSSYDHSHDHNHSDKSKKAKSGEKAKTVYNGYFDDDQIEPRPLSDWSGDWQSVYPYLMDGTLQPVMEKKAKSGDMTAEEYREYYEIGYETDTQRIVIEAEDGSEEGTFTFFDGDSSVSGTYVTDGYEILTYKKGNRGVRYIFEKSEGDDNAPDFVQFSDHAISPNVADHYHLYWGDDRAALLEEVTNWPTYYPSELNADGILDEMLAH